MIFDLFYELSVPAFAQRSESQVFHETLLELELADHLGFNAAWLVEHHFMPEYSHSSAPDLFLAAASQRTQHLRLGHGIIPLPYHHPVQIAERLATLDILSNGRVEFGFGRGFSPKEYQCFGSDISDSRSMTQEALEVIQCAFTGDPVNFTGTHYQIDNIDILPKCQQTPHPPIWSAAISPDSIEFAAKFNYGALLGPFKPWFMIQADIRRYLNTWHTYRISRDPGSTSQLPSPRIAMAIGLYCHEDTSQARNEAGPGLVWFYRQLLRQTTPVLKKLYEGYEYYRKLGHLRYLYQPMLNLTVLEKLGMVIVGNPQHCIEKLTALQQAGVTHVLCAMGAGVMSSQQTRRSMQIFADKVIPHFS